MTSGTTRRRLNALEARSHPNQRVVLVIGEAGEQCETAEEALERYIHEHGSDSIREDDCLWIVTFVRSKWRQPEVMTPCEMD